ncbi:MAG TPA: glyoxalase [Salinimicrobium sp.]|nr:glyoxalase [Salinimicrobium sp.]
MERRDQLLSQTRLAFIEVDFNHLAMKDEMFHRKTIRPIIKFQQNLLIGIFKNYIRKHKNKFHELIPEEQLLYIENAIQKDLKFRNILKGVIIGQFTIAEFSDYIENSSALNKRILISVKEELQENLLLLAAKQSFFVEKTT